MDGLEIDLVSINMKAQRISKRDYYKSNEEQIIKTKSPPSGNYCNPEVRKWCDNLHADYCIKHKTLLWTYTGLKGPLFIQRKCSKCVEELKNNEPEQIKLEGFK